MSMPAEHMTSLPTLADLLQGIKDAPAIAVSGIASDSRELQKGDLFLAVKGIGSHGLDYLENARNAGVCAVVWDSATADEPADIGVPMIAVEGLASQLGEIANRFYGYPSRQLEVVGVTGTNGKTTIAWMIAQAVGLLGERCAYLGTLGFGVDEIEGAEGMTTPAAIRLHGLLAGFLERNASHAAIEVSSHALSQGRVDGVRFKTAVFANLTRDHLDYHADMREYFEAKARLFTDCEPRERIINIDSEYGVELASLCGQDVVSVSTQSEHAAKSRLYLSANAIVPTERGSEVSFTSTWGNGQFALSMPGDFNVANAVLVLALLLNRGVPLDAACDVMSQISAPPGRMQRVAADDPAVYIDYAHTPDALDVSLRALRAHCRGRLWCVFGCGGNRDTGKRPQMGRVAEKQSDYVLVTTDNPRSEDAASIIADIMAGLREPDTATVIEDRAAAIAWAIEQAQENDVVLVAGKGHEDYQDVAGKRLRFSDFAVAESALAARRSVS